jgi:hypothetical protein
MKLLGIVILICIILCLAGYMKIDGLIVPPYNCVTVSLLEHGVFVCGK